MVEPTTTEPITIYGGWTTCRKDGSPVMGTVGSGTIQVIVFPIESWRRMMAEHPSLQSQQFKVGEL